MRTASRTRRRASRTSCWCPAPASRCSACATPASSASSSPTSRSWRTASCSAPTWTRCTASCAAAVPLDDIYVCPHDKSEGCRCHKPATGMLDDAVERWGIDLATSYVIGDRWRDVDAGRNGRLLLHPDRAAVQRCVLGRRPGRHAGRGRGRRATPRAGEPDRGFRHALLPGSPAGGGRYRHGRRESDHRPDGRASATTAADCSSSGSAAAPATPGTPSTTSARSRTSRRTRPPTTSPS